MGKIKNKFVNSIKKWNSKTLCVKIFLIAMFLFFLFQAVIQLIPFMWVINNSLKTDYEFVTAPASITSSWQFSNYLSVFSEFKYEGTVTYLGMLGNSLWQTFLYLFVNLLSSLLVAYAIAKFKFPGRGLLYSFMIFIQIMPIIGTGAAGYKLRHTLGMIDNPLTIWICWAVGFDYSAFILYGTLQGLSDSYTESAEIDGANEFQIFVKVVLPLIFPCVLALMVTNFIGRWNDYTTAQINLRSYPSLSYGMFLFNTGGGNNKNVLYFASIIMSSIPGVILYIAFQGLIIKNVAVGGIKG